MLDGKAILPSGRQRVADVLAALADLREDPIPSAQPDLVGARVRALVVREALH